MTQLRLNFPTAGNSLTPQSEADQASARLNDGAGQCGAIVEVKPSGTSRDHADDVAPSTGLQGGGVYRDGGSSGGSSGVEGDNEGAIMPARPGDFEEALQEVARCALLPEEKLRRLRSDITVAGRCVWQSLPHSRPSTVFGPADLPCDPVELRPLLQHVMPGKFWADKPGKLADNVKHQRLDRVKHRWSTICSSLSKILTLTGWVENYRHSPVELTLAWISVADCHVHPTQRALARRFGRYCVSHGIAPVNVRDDTIEAFRDHLRVRTLDLSVTRTINALRRVWNISCKKLDCDLTFLNGRKRPRSYVLPNEALPDGFLTDLEDYLALLLKPGPFNERGIRRPRKQITVNCLRETLKRFASVALTSGISSAHVKTVSDLGKPAAVHAILIDQYSRVGGDRGWPPGAVTIASYLKMIIKHSPKLLSAEEKSASILLCENVTGPKAGVTRKNRDRLAIINDPKVLDRLLNVPGECYKAAEAWFKASHETVKGARDGCPKGKVAAAHLYQRAVALDILFTKPLRRAMLVGLDMQRHIKFDDKGTPLAFCIPGSETKNGQDAEATFPQNVGERLKTYIEFYRPLLGPGNKPYLFPGKNGNHLHPQTLANGIVSIVHDYAGLPFNAHLMRHLVATLIMDADPANGPIAQRMLDHTDLKTTTRFYGIQRTKSAQAKYAKILEDRCGEARSRGFSTLKGPQGKKRPNGRPEKKQ